MTAKIMSMPGPVLHAQVTQRLRQMLVENQITPGTKLNERELSAVLHVSRTPLREAIKTLAAEGLVELLPNRGAVAALLTDEDIRHTFEVLACLEGQSGLLAAERITDAALAEIEAMHYEMMASYVRRDLSTYYSRNAAIHRAINRAAGNPVLSATYEQVNARLQALRFKTNQDGAKWKRAVAEHEQMIQALKARDGQTLHDVLVDHLASKRDVVLAQRRDAAAATSVPTAAPTLDAESLANAENPGKHQRAIP